VYVVFRRVSAEEETAKLLSLYDARPEVWDERTRTKKRVGFQ
jgi:hypothetical protein